MKSKTQNPKSPSAKSRRPDFCCVACAPKLDKLGFWKLGFWALGFLLLVSCIAQPGPVPTPLPPTIALAEPTPTPTVEPDKSPLPQPTVAPVVQILRLWLPPQFEPTVDTVAGQLLLDQLTKFEDVHPGWRVEVRVKKVAGQGGLINALQTALQSAPGLSPDVIALDGPMLTTAAPLIQPLTARFTEDELSDFYPFALQAARVDDQLLGLPFAADALGLAYSSAVYVTPPLAWVDLNTGTGPLWLPLSDPTALVILQQYVALGGSLADEDGNPAIDPGLLAQVLAYYQFLQVNNLISAASLGAASLSETWVAYRESRATSSSALTSAYLAERERVAATAFTLLPTREGNRLTFASQWNYALVAADPARQAVALELMRWLTASDKLGEWTMAVGMLPTRGKALARWPDADLRAIAGEALTAAQPMPSPSLLNVLGPPITTAVQDVLAGRSSAEAAANAAAQAIAGR